MKTFIAGMRVRIMKREQMCSCPHHGFVADMERFIGRVFEIKEVSGKTIRFHDEETFRWHWSDDMVELAEIVKDDVIYDIADVSDCFTAKQVAAGTVIIEGTNVYKKTRRKVTVEMTVAEIEAKLGIKNLKIKK